jgi:hypothetical protein
MNCETPDCPETAAFLVRSEGMTDDGIMVIVLWSGWGKVDGGMYCVAHAQKLLATLPLLAPPLARGAADDAEVYTHG